MTAACAALLVKVGCAPLRDGVPQWECDPEPLQFLVEERLVWVSSDWHVRLTLDGATVLLGDRP